MATKNAVLIPLPYQQFTSGPGGALAGSSSDPGELVFSDKLSDDQVSRELIALGIPYAAAKSFKRAVPTKNASWGEGLVREARGGFDVANPLGSIGSAVGDLWTKLTGKPKPPTPTGATANIGGGGEEVGWDWSAKPGESAAWQGGPMADLAFMASDEFGTGLGTGQNITDEQIATILAVNTAAKQNAANLGGQLQNLGDFEDFGTTVTGTGNISDSTQAFKEGNLDWQNVDDLGYDLGGVGSAAGGTTDGTGLSVAGSGALQNWQKGALTTDQLAALANVDDLGYNLNTKEKPKVSEGDSDIVRRALERVALSDGIRVLVDKLLDGSITPDELGNLLSDSEFISIYETEFGPIINPILTLAVENATEQAGIAAGLSQAEIEALSREVVADIQARGGTDIATQQATGAVDVAKEQAAADKAAAQSYAGAQTAAGQAAATVPGAILSMDDSTVQNILDSVQLGVTGLSTDADVLKSQKIAASGGFSQPGNMLDALRIGASGGYDEAADMLNALRIQASGGLSNEVNIRGIQQAQAANNPFASLQLGGGLPTRTADILAILKAQSAGQTGANAVAQQANFLNYISNPAAVATGIQGGYNPLDDMNFRQSIADSDRGMVPAVVAGLESTGQSGPGYAGPGYANPNAPPVQGADEFSGEGLGQWGSTVSGLAPTTPWSGGLGSDFTAGQLGDLSEGQRQGAFAEQALQGLAPDVVEKRARSYTPAYESGTQGIYGKSQWQN